MKRPKYIEKISNDSAPDRLGIVFNTRNNKYYYDRGTNKVIQCEEWEQCIISELLQGC